MAMMTTPAPIVRSPTSKKQLDSAAMQRYKDETQYYIDAKGEKVMPMSWQGEAARALWLTDKPITPKAFERMLDGKDPRNGASLTKKAGTTGRNKLGWDCVNNADKTFSLTLALAEPAERDRLIAAMQRANAASIKHLESRLTIRTGKEGNLEPVKGLAVASMVHLGSRELDPHAHCHNVIMAAGMRADGSFGNLDEAELRRFTKEAGMVFQAELCRELVALNYAVERDPKNEWSTRIVGYTDEQIDAFSNGRRLIEEKAKQLGVSLKDSKALDKIAKLVRKPKKEPPLATLFEDWREAAASHGITQRQLDRLKSPPATPKQPLDLKEIAARCVEKNGRFSKSELFYECGAALSQRGGATAAEIEALRDGVLADRSLIVKLGATARNIKGGKLTEDAYTTREVINREAALYMSYERAQKDDSHKLDAAEVDAAIASYEAKKSAEFGKPVKMKSEQVEALRAVAFGGSQCIVHGYAGTGKSFTAGAWKEAYEAKGYRILATSHMASAAKDLATGAGIDDANSLTLHKLTHQLESGKFAFGKRDLILVDEAGMVGSDLIRKLQRHADIAGAKIVFIGDHQQRQSIDAGGGWLLGLQERFGATAILSEITRQRDEKHIEAVHHFREGRGEEGLAYFEERGLLHESQTKEEILRAIADDYLAATKATVGGVEKELAAEEKLMIAAKRDDAATLSSMVRETLAARGELTGPGFNVQCWKQTGTDPKAPKERWERELRANDLIRFKENNSKLGVENGLAARIESIRELRDGSHQITAKLPRGKAVSFNTRDYAAIEWGYSSTSIGSQGKTVELAFALVEPQQERSTAAYVEASRSKGDTHLYCTSEDRPQLAAAMSQEDKRGWTVDFLDRNFLDRGLILTKDKAELCKRTGRSWTELATPAPGREADARAAIEAQLKREAAAQPAAQDQPKRDAAAQKPARPWTAEEIALARSVSPERAARAEQAAKEYLERKAAQEHLQREAERARGHFKPEPERQRASISFSR
ncbi:MobF family relaxase [Cupriavidus metallidurans]|uniref:MobF family relaxase n=1 Tax=Cupriavidus metallidurans TaxID=119219 RepID=UPI000CE010DC|nr:MobF family relaxase [Cupriavidus metallidurans]AVA36295.1 hypothetical protein C3Z06_23565 [Cupriavidus metallidurans]AVA36616.1 hypothetical protein C3Z06_25365 [Cupriavidus metallidurans]